MQTLLWYYGLGIMMFTSEITRFAYSSFIYVLGVCLFENNIYSFINCDKVKFLTCSTNDDTSSPLREKQ